MTFFRERRGVASVTGAGLIGAPFLLVGAPALAADSCGTTDPAATQVSAGVCEVSFATAGDFTFSAPTGVTKLTALIVGAGGSSGADNTGAYGGGGGNVVFVGSVDVSAPVAVTVGLGADGNSQGESSSVNSDLAEGGYSGMNTPTGPCDCAGSSGNGNAGSSYWNGTNETGAGGGAGGAAFLDAPGVGVSASDIADDTELWPALADEPIYGAGGNAMINPGSLVGNAGDGAIADGVSAGNDGLVVLRWAPIATSEPALVNTGLTTWSIALSALMAGALFFVASGTFRARSELQFAGSRQRLVSLLREADLRLRRTERTGSDERGDAWSGEKNA